MRTMYETGGQRYVYSTSEEAGNRREVYPMPISGCVGCGLGSFPTPNQLVKIVPVAQITTLAQALAYSSAAGSQAPGVCPTATKQYEAANAQINQWYSLGQNDKVAEAKMLLASANAACDVAKTGGGTAPAVPMDSTVVSGTKKTMLGIAAGLGAILVLSILTKKR